MAELVKANGIPLAYVATSFFHHGFVPSSKGWKLVIEYYLLLRRGLAKNNLDAVVNQLRILVAKSTYVITERLIVHVKHAPKHIHDIFETRRIFLQNWNRTIPPCHQLIKRSFRQVLARVLELSLPILDSNANTANTYQLGLKTFGGPNY